MWQKLGIGVLLLILAACGQSPQNGTVNNDNRVGANQLREGQLIVQYTVVTESESSRGDAVKMPDYQFAYLFDNGKVKGRMDIPGAMNHDGKARILVGDLYGQARVLAADTLKSDGSIQWAP